jgi:hypothetical protein
MRMTPRVHDPILSMFQERFFSCAQAEADNGGKVAPRNKKQGGPQQSQKDLAASRVASQQSEDGKPAVAMKRSASPRTSATSPRRFVHVLHQAMDIRQIQGIAPL